MISGKSKKELSITAILNLITAYDVYRFYFGDFKVNEITTNHIRGDKTPSFIIGNKGGELHHYDFADDHWRGDCFEFVQTVFGLNFNDALKKIDSDFGLGLSDTPVGDYKQIVGQYKQPEELGKRYSLIQIITRPFTQEELAYWAQYYQTKDDLRANNIYSIKTAFLNKSKFSLSDDTLRFGYLYDGYWKIYRPYMEKRHKWVSNVPLNLAYGLNNLQPDKNTMICKSLKDYLVCRKVYEHVCHVQNESLAAFSVETVEHIRDNSAFAFYGGDSDIPGKQASYAITEAFGFKHVNPPDRLLPDVKDWADWAKEEGLQVIEDHLKLKGVICPERL